MINKTKQVKKYQQRNIKEERRNIFVLFLKKNEFTTKRQTFCSEKTFCIIYYSIPERCLISNVLRIILKLKICPTGLKVFFQPLLIVLGRINNGFHE